MPNSSLLRRIGAVLAAALLHASPAAAWEAIEGPEVTPESGLWWAPEEPGRALVIEVLRPGRLFAGLLFHDADGTPTWTIVEATGTGATQSGTLQAFAGGQTLDGPWRPNSLAGSLGTATFSFETPTSGWLESPAGRTRIERADITAGFGISAPRQRGAWWFNGSESGRGFFVEARGGILFVLGTMYDERGRAVWYTAQGPMTTPQLFQGSLTRSDIGDGQPAHAATLGTLTMQFNDGSTGMITTPGGRQIPVVRYGLCLEVQRLARLGMAASHVLPGFPWPGCGQAPQE